MKKDQGPTLTRDERKTIIAAAATLKEASDHLYSLASSKMKDMVDARWLISQTYKNLLEVLKLFNIDT